MKTMRIYEPAMCCPTGLCGVSIDSELLRISAALSALKQSNVDIQRFNLTGSPEEFVKSKPVTEYIQKFGTDKLPVTVVDDFIVIAGRYPTNEEIVSWLDLPANALDLSCSEGDASALAGCCEASTPTSCCDDEANAESDRSNASALAGCRAKSCC